MIRNLKALGLALCAVCAFGALSASAASAANDLLTSGSGSGTTYLTGEQIGGLGGANVFGSHSNVGKIECEKATYTGSYPETVAAQVEVSPVYTNCLIGKSKATVTPNGCKFVLTGTTHAFTNTKGVAEGDDATVSLNCSDQAIIVHGPLSCVITFGDTHPANTKVNQNLLGVKYDNETDAGGKKDVKVTVTVDKVVYTSNANCQALGFDATGKEGFLTTSVTTKAYEDAAHTKQVNLSQS